MAIFKYDPLPLKEVEETQEKQHPWARTIKDVYSHRIKHAHNSISNPIYPGKEEKQPERDRVQFTVIGDRVTKEFAYCSNLVKGLYKYRWKNFYFPVIRGCNTIEWPEILHDLKLRFIGIPCCLQSSVAVLFNDIIIGGEKELQKLVETKLFYYLCLDYYNEGVAEFARFIQSTSRPFAYMHVSIDDKHVGTLIYMLYADIVPYTSENFLRLCKETKGGYGGTPVHRIVKDGWIQCGGFGLKRTSLSCENFIIPFDRRGVLAMANDGRDEDCSTQFFVLLQPALWMNHKYVAFGQLIEGAATLEEIERVTTWYESPTSQIILYRCGILNMVCHDIRINKEADQYIDGHIEDLNSLAEVIWEHLLEKTFLQAQLRELERLRALEGEGTEASSQYDEPAKMPERKGNESSQFEIEEMESKEEEEDDSYKYQSVKSASQVEKTHRPYYIPLTDVPYPGDVESDFNLKKFLKGDYCLESDLFRTEGEFAVFPFELWNDSPSSSSISEGVSLRSEDRLEIDRYIKENVNKVSFAGVVIKNIALDKKSVENFERYYFEFYSREPIIADSKLRKIKMAAAEFELRQKNKKDSIFTDEKLRKIKLAAAEYEIRLKNKKAATGRRCHVPNDLVRQTTDVDGVMGVRKMAEFSQLSHSHDTYKQQSVRGQGDDDSSTDDDDDVVPTPFDNTRKDDDKDVVEPEQDKAPQFRFATQNGPEETGRPKGFLKRRLTAFIRPEDLPVDNGDDDDDDDDDDLEEPESQNSITAASDIRKSDGVSDHEVSELTRLYVGVDNDEPVPTLKNYKPIAELQRTKNLLTLSSDALPASSKESRLGSRLKRQRHSLTLEESFVRFANIQHGPKLDNKLSSDYVKTIDKFEKNRFSHSIRSMEYAKKRPTMSVSQYQLMNRQYQEALDRKATPL